MFFQKYTPSIPLGEFVDYLYIDSTLALVASETEFNQPLHPRLLVGLSVDTAVGSNIKGVHTRPVKKGAQANAGTLGIRLKPYGLFTGFGIPGVRATNAIIPASLLFPPEVAGELVAVAAKSDEQALIEYFHDALYRQLRPNPILFEITDMVDALLAADLSKNSQKHLAAEFERTPKSFIELFKKAVGITPLSYLHVYKVEEAKRMMQQYPSHSLTDITYQLGFYDQAHSIRIFKSHTGLTPLQYRKRMQQVAVNPVQF